MFLDLEKGSKEEEAEVFEDTQTKKNKEGVVTEIHTVTTIKRHTDIQGIMSRHQSPQILCDLTSTGHYNLQRRLFYRTSLAVLLV